MLLQLPDEAMAGGRLKVARVDLARKVEKGLGIVHKVVDVEHGLRVGQRRIVHMQPCVDAVLGPKVRDAWKGKENENENENENDENENENENENEGGG